MERVEPSSHILFVPDRVAGVELLRRCEYMARISHRTEEKQTEESWERFITSVVVNHGDWSVMRHASVSVEVVVNRALATEWRTHKFGAYSVEDETDDLFPFTQESTRFVNSQKHGGVKAICPFPTNSWEESLWEISMRNAEVSYNELLGAGYSPQIARDLLPHSVAAKFGVTFNLHQWRYFFIMRTTKETHEALRLVTIPLLEEFQDKIPIIYEDIVPNNLQRTNLRLPR